MSLLARPMTYQDLKELPDDGFRYEVIDGELVVTPAPIKKHQRLSAALFDLFYDQEQAGHGEAYYAPVDVRLFPERDVPIVQPDLLFIRRERLHIFGPELVEGAPDLVVEILSPSTRSRDLVRKAELYAEAGVRAYWIADPDAPALTIFVLRDGRYEPLSPVGRTLRSTVLPELVIDLDALFAVLGP